MSEWSSATVGDLFELATGYAFKSADFKRSGVPVIKIKNVKAGRFSKQGLSYVDARFLHERSDKIAQEYDLLISMSGNRHDGSPETWVGKVCLFSESAAFLINQRVAALRLKKDKLADVRFFGFLLSSMHYQERFIAIATSSGGQANLSPDQILGEPVYYPDLVNQRRIGDLLGSLDDKIDLNRRMNETLEAMARAIFKDWFVDFGPTRAKAEGRASYLAAEIWDLFPDALDGEDKPEGWSFAPLTALAEMNPESWSRKNTPEEVKYVDLANTKWGTIEATQRFPWQDAPSRAKRVLQPGDTIVGMVRPSNGSFAFLSDSGLTGSTGFAVLRPRQSRYTELVFLSATAPENIKRLAKLADGAAYPAVRPDVVGATEVAFCGDAVAFSFSALVSPIFGRMESNKRENLTLAQTRDLLLPKLMSGEIRLSKAEKVVEAVA